MKKKYKVPCVWQMMGYITVYADSEEESIFMAEKLMNESATPLPKGEYLDESFEIDKEGSPLLCEDNECSIE